jgi:hypothetical protein
MVDQCSVALYEVDISVRGIPMAAKVKDHLWIKTFKWHLYKRRHGNARWRADYLFDCAVRRLRPGDVVVDCGANIGLITLRLAARGATVHAFEPDPYSFGRLRAATAGLQTSASTIAL